MASVVEHEKIEPQSFHSAKPHRFIGGQMLAQQRNALY
jgi:hypothetical protein